VFAQAPGGQDPAVWLKSIPQDCLRRLGWDERDQPYFMVWGADRSVIRTSSPAPDAPYPDDRKPDGADFRQRNEFREAILSGPDGSTILVGRSIAREEASLASLQWSLLGAGAAVLAIGLLGSWVLSDRVLRPIQTISETARAISASDLSKRIDLREMQSELGSLAETLNATFDRLEAAFHRQVRFVADASHELRTPLSVIHTNSEVALNRQRTPDEYRQIIETSLRTSRRMKSLVESLLILARADADALELKYDRIDLRLAVDESVAMLVPMALHSKVSIQSVGESVCIEADRDRIQQLITNLATNAIKYNREGGSVSIAVGRENGHALLKVADTGIGIAPHDQPHVFERFFRADKARSRESGGAGLGLAICQSIADAHGGSISYKSEPGTGTVFMVRLPVGDHAGCDAGGGEPG
jgi:heavy metal sensor kinase